MSTRCQVLVTQEGIPGWPDQVMLYHHCDGYPSNIVMLLQKAWSKVPKGWESGRTGKVAGMVCASDPGQFEPESGVELHGDIEWLYRLVTVNRERGSAREEAWWRLEVYRPKQGSWEVKERTIEEHFDLVWKGKIEEAQGAEIEKAEADDGE